MKGIRLVLGASPRGCGRRGRSKSYVALGGGGDLVRAAHHEP
jgi:hypothetical protein